MVRRYKVQKSTLKMFVSAAGLQMEGRLHGALDDARNTARLAIQLLQEGVKLKMSECFERQPLLWQNK